MDDILDDLTRAARRCDQAARTFNEGTFAELRERIQAQVKAADRAFSGSCLGYHSRVFIKDFEPARPDERWDSEWGRVASFSNTTAGRWVVYDEEEAKAEILRRARISEGDQAFLRETAAKGREIFDETKAEVMPTLDAALAVKEDAVVRRVRDEIEKLESFTTERTIVADVLPSQMISRDSPAAMEGVKVPPHMQLEARVLSQLSHGFQLAELAKHARYLTTYFQKGMKMKGKSVARTEGKIFIGHGRSKVWRDLKDFIKDRLNLEWDEFNREATAGLSTKERIESMLDEAVFAFLVMTAEDELADGKVQARANVIHEIGLFQGRLGFERAIVLLEQGCEEFSNIVGITQIRFSVGNVGAQFEEIRRVLEREKILRT